MRSTQPNAARNALTQYSSVPPGQLPQFRCHCSQLLPWSPAQPKTIQAPLHRYSSSWGAGRWPGSGVLAARRDRRAVAAAAPEAPAAAALLAASMASLLWDSLCRQAGEQKAACPKSGPGMLASSGHGNQPAPAAPQTPSRSPTWLFKPSSRPGRHVLARAARSQHPPSYSRANPRQQHPRPSRGSLPHASGPRR